MNCIPLIKSESPICFCAHHFALFLIHDGTISFRIDMENDSTSSVSYFTLTLYSPDERSSGIGISVSYAPVDSGIMLNDSVVPSGFSKITSSGTPCLYTISPEIGIDACLSFGTVIFLSSFVSTFGTDRSFSSGLNASAGTSPHVPAASGQYVCFFAASHPLTVTFPSVPSGLISVYSTSTLPYENEILSVGLSSPLEPPVE